jgi:hypothetical protein
MFWYEFNGFLYVEKKMFDNFFFPRQNAGDEPRRVVSGDTCSTVLTFVCNLKFDT